MQLLLTTSSLREQRATTILIKTGIQGTAIYRVSMQNAYCICVQELMPPTVVQQSKGSKLKGKDNTPYSEVSPPKSTCTVCVCLCTCSAHTHVVILPLGSFIAGIYCVTHEGVYILSSTPWSFTKGQGRRLAGGTSPAPGGKLQRLVVFN